jgi:c-di-GMP-binding flagellar brake protein YcgR
MDMTETERREHFRIEVVTPVRFRLIEEKTLKPLTDWINGSTVDVSLGGVKITAPMSEAEVDTLIGKYVLISLSCQLPGNPKTISATATIAYFLRGAAVSKATTITFGASFVNIDYGAEDVIGEFIHQRIDSPA